MNRRVDYGVIEGRGGGLGQRLSKDGHGRGKGYALNGGIGNTAGRGYGKGRFATSGIGTSHREGGYSPDDSHGNGDGTGGYASD